MSRAETGLILQHQDDAPPGLLLDALDAAGATVQTVHLDRGEALPHPGSVRFAVSLGSDASADDRTREWIGREQEWLRGADRAGTTLLGLCFGAQALALALGGGVRRASLPERDWVHVTSSEPALVSPGPWLAWHDDVIELPPGATLIAHNPSGPQAFRSGAHLGIQFHPEVTPGIVSEWVRGARPGDVDGTALLAATRREFERAAGEAARLFSGFLAAVGRR